MRWSAVALTFACLPWTAAVAAPGYPDFDGWVVDSAHALTLEERGELHQIASRLDGEKLAQLAVAVVRPEDLDELSRSEYAVELFRRWKLGHSKASSDGLLLLLVTGPPGKRGLKVEVGYGLEGVLPDGKVGALMDESAGPHLKKGEMGAGAVALARALAATVETGAARGDKTSTPWLAAGTATALALLPGAAVLALFLVFVAGYARQRVPGRVVTFLALGALLACLPGFIGLIAGDRWLIWAVFATLALAVVDILLYFDLADSRCPRDGRWLHRRVRWLAFAIDKQCRCGYETVFSFAPDTSRAVSRGGGSAGVQRSDWSGGGGGESGGGGADREY